MDLQMDVDLKLIQIFGSRFKKKKNPKWFHNKNRFGSKIWFNFLDLDWI